MDQMTKLSKKYRNFTEKMEVFLKPLQVLNVKFFRKKGVIDTLAINRGVYCIWMAITKEGGAVVKMKGFDRYFFDPDTGEVFSKVGVRAFRPIKRHCEGGKPYFELYLHGTKTKVTWAQILRDNIKGIELFFSEEDPAGRKERHGLVIAS